MEKATVTMSVERYNELIAIETIYHIQRRRVKLDKYRMDIDCLLFDVPTRDEEMSLAKIKPLPDDDF